VRFTRRLDAPAAKVWAFLSDSARLPEWHGDGLIEPREGGTVSLMAGQIRGVVTGWRKEKFLAYTWNVFSPGETQSRWPMSYVEFTLADDGGGTRLALIHRPIPAAMQGQTPMGWHTMLDLIAAGLREEFPRRAELLAQNAALYGVDLDNLAKASP
jgi:uncharacterized protein YndB with AHSA1/START domain